MKKFDLDKLKYYCLADEEELMGLGMFNGLYSFIDKGGDVLAVAHLDHVGGVKSNFDIVHVNGEILAFSMAMDDRLGAYIINEILPLMGIRCDVLFTTGEETCNSTARFFEAEKEYNWTFSFDRGGCDVVAYQYQFCHEWCMLLLENSFYMLGQGTYSDIVELEHLGVCGVNVGTGYYEKHTPICYAKLSDVNRMLFQFKKFYDRTHNIRVDYICDDYMGEDDYDSLINYPDTPSGFGITGWRTETLPGFDEEGANYE